MIILRFERRVCRWESCRMHQFMPRLWSHGDVVVFWETSGNYRKNASNQLLTQVFRGCKDVVFLAACRLWTCKGANHWAFRMFSLARPKTTESPWLYTLVQLQETLRSDRRGWGWKSLTRHHFAHVVQCRDGALKTRPVSVRVRPWAPAFALRATARRANRV